MKPEQPFSNDDASTRIERVEQRLRQLQPRPVTFDAESVLSADRQRERQVALPVGKVPEQETRPARWITIAASWTCGAVAGALLMWLLMMPRNVDGPQARTGAKDAKEAAPQVDSSSAKAEDQVLGNRLDNAKPARDRQLGLDLPHWSEDERLVSTQLMDLRRRWALEDSPLTAGRYTLRAIASVPGIANSAARQPDPATTSRNSADNLPANTVRPPLSIDADPLLEELLGARLGSRL